MLYQIKAFNITVENGEHILEPLGSFENYTEDWRCMAELILQVIIFLMYFWINHSVCTFQNQYVSMLRIKNTVKPIKINFPITESCLNCKNSHSWQKLYCNYYICCDENLSKSEYFLTLYQFLFLRFYCTYILIKLNKTLCSFYWIL